MAIIAVNNWLNGSRDYTAGVSLYRQHGSNKVLLNLFATSQNPYTERKLVEELEAINRASAPPDELPAKKHHLRQRDLMLSAFRPKEEHTYPAVDLTAAPEGLKRLDRERRALFQQAAELYTLLCAGHFKTKAERFEALKTIDDNFYGPKGIQAIWKRIDFWKQYGRFVPFTATPPKQPVSREELLRELLNVRTNVSRYRNRKDKRHLYDKWYQQQIDIEQKLLDNAKE